MAQWFFSYDGRQSGPFDDAAAIAQARRDANGYAWREGFADWLPIGEVPELSGAAPGGAPPRPPPASSFARRADEIDYRIVGNDMQFVEVELDPGESVVAEAGALMYKDAAVELETVFGDASYAAGGGFVDKLISAGKRVISGEGLFTTLFTHRGGAGKAHAAFAAPYPGTIHAMRLTDYGGTLICQKDSFLCGARGVQLGIYFQRKILTGLFGGEGFVMERLDGDGLVFVHAGGSVVARELAAGERIDVDTGCVVAFTRGIDFDVRPVGGIKSMLFGGEGVFLATLTGPGKVWLQSLPFSRLAGRMLASAPQRGGHRDEGSLLGGLGTILSGDRDF
ncbi:MAG TPA: TIGR00266 family protein [Dokdonella sp.]